MRYANTRIAIHCADSAGRKIEKARSALRSDGFRATAASDDLVSATRVDTAGWSHAVERARNGEGPRRTAGAPRSCVRRAGSEVHVAAGHADPGRELLILRLLRHDRLRGHEQLRVPRLVLQRCARQLG